MQIDASSALNTLNHTLRQRPGTQGEYAIRSREEVLAQAAQPVRQPVVKATDSVSIRNTPQTVAEAAQSGAASSPLLDHTIERRVQPPAPQPAPAFGEAHLEAIRGAFGSVKGQEGYTEFADANGDGIVDFNDTTHVLANWGKTSGENTALPNVYGPEHLEIVKGLLGAQEGDDRYAATADPNGDGVIDFNDITFILSNWGKPVPPSELNSGA